MQSELEKYFDKLWPICRSITGNGLRESFRILQEIIPLELVEVKSGTSVFDWEIPDEWNITDAYIITPDGKKICEFTQNNLHVLNYSEPVDAELNYEELAKHIHTLPSQPKVIPYITSYYKRTWGFCMSHDEFLALPKQGKYRAVVKSSLKPGSLTYGHLVLKGSTDREVLLSSYLCHPGLANNELSGPLALSFLYQKISSLKNRRYTYRFVLAPETIGVIAYLSQHGNEMKEKTDAGFVITCCGDKGKFNYKRSKHKTSLADRATENALKFSGEEFSVREFSVGGSDERQYCSPGFNLPVGSLMRSVYHEYKEYHTSADDKSFISFPHLEKTIELYFNIVRTIELNSCYKGTVQQGEPRLGKYDLYPAHASRETKREDILKLLHLLSFADGKTDLLEIAERFGCSALEFENAISVCRQNGLLQ